MKTKTHQARLALLLQSFFTERLTQQRMASGCTVQAYRDAFRLLLRYAGKRIGRSPVELSLSDLDAPLVIGFLDHLEKERSNGARSRNARLAAIRAFMRYAAFQEPAMLPTIQRVLAIPMKRFNRTLVGFLSLEEVEALLDAPNRSTWTGERDHAMLATFYNTGARVSEIASMRVSDLVLVGASSVHIRGKGRKERAVPLWNATAKTLRHWVQRLGADGTAPVFPNGKGEAMTRSGIAERLRAAVHEATKVCPSLGKRPVSPHTLRHTTAMHLLQSDVDITVIALWLGHESISTTHQYVEADLSMKKRER